MKNFLLFFVLLIFTFTTYAQSTILFEDFEDATLIYTTSVAEFSDGANDYFTRTDGTNISSAVNFTNKQGASFFGAQDITGIGGPGEVELNFTNINISGFSDLAFSFFIAEDDASDGMEDWDANSSLSVSVSIDGGANMELFIINAPTTNSQPRFSNTSTFITDAFTEYIFPIAGTGTSMDMTISIINLNAGDEDIAIDNIKIIEGAVFVPSVGFDIASSTENETDATFSVDIPVTLSNYQTANVDLSVTVSGGDAELGDYALNTTTLSFTGDGTQNISIDINDDVDFDDETIELTISETTSTGAIITQATHTVTIVDNELPPLPNVVINEIHADPAGDITGDANGDGIRDSGDDEFIELYNTTANSIDISGWTISDGTSIRHTFAIETTIPANGFVTVFGGGDISAVPGIKFVASEGTLSLNNSGDDVILDNGSIFRSVAIDAFTYGSGTIPADQDQSIGKDPDGSGNFVQHSTITGALFSPNTSNAALVPVTVSSFSGHLSYNFINLSWTTSTEINNTFFNIERSTDKVTFQTIGKVQGNGTTSEVKDYSFIDRSPASGINYYRLAQFDFNGEMEYHKVIAVDNRGESTSIYPTLTDSEITINVNKPAKVTIFSTNGAVVKTFKLEESKQVNVGDLPDGIYTLITNSQGNIETHRFIKQ